MEAASQGLLRGSDVLPYMGNCFVLWSLSRLTRLACQASLSMGFPRQEYWSGLPFPSPGDRPDPGIEPASPPLAGRFFTTEPPGKPCMGVALNTCVHLKQCTVDRKFHGSCHAVAAALLARSCIQTQGFQEPFPERARLGRKDDVTHLITGEFSGHNGPHIPH